MFLSRENEIWVSLKLSSSEFVTLFEVKRLQNSAIRIKIIGTYRTDPMQLNFLSYSETQNNVANTVSKLTIN